MKFKFEAYNKAGKLQRGEVQAVTKNYAQDQLKKEGLKKITLQEVKRGGFFNSEISFGRVKLMELAVFTKNLSVMIKAGIPLFEAFAISAEQSRGKLKTVINKVLRALEGGVDLNEALSRHPRVFNELYINIVRAGEASGTLELNLNNLAAQLEKDIELRSKVKSSMIYPMTVLGAAICIAYFLAIFVLPKMTGLISSLDIELPWTTRAVLWVSNAFQTQTVAIVLGTIVFVLAVIWLPRFKFLKPYTHPIVLKIPVIKNVVKNYNLALFCRTFGTLLQSGLLIDEALLITSNVLKNQPYKKLLKNSIKEINQGVTLGDSLEARKDLFPPIVTRMIAVGERSGRLDETLLYLATFYETQVDLAIKGLTTSLEPMLLIAIGFVVAVVALSIITPIYKITGSIGR